MYMVKVHSHERERMVAACDEELLGRTIDGGKVRITVSEAFYGGEPLDEEGLVQRLGIATIINLVGNDVVDIAIREGFVSPDSVIEIGGVKHAQAVLM